MCAKERERERLTCDLSDEGYNIQPDKYLRDLDSLDSPYLLLGKEEIDHSSHDHVIESVDPHWSQQDENLRDESNGCGLLVLGSRNTQSERSKLPCRSHDYYPAETELFVCESLIDMRESSDSKNNGEDKCCGERWIVVVVGITCPLWDVAILSRGHGDAGTCC